MESSDAWRIALAGFLVVTGLGLTYVLIRLGATLGRLNTILEGVSGEIVPMLGKVSTTLDHVNDELDKVNRITETAVDAADKLDSAARAVSIAVTKPVKAASGVSAGVAHAFNSFRGKRSQRGGVV